MTMALSAAELLRHPPAPAKVPQDTQTWTKLGTSRGAKKKDAQRKSPRNCPSPGHQVSSPGGGSSTRRGVQEEAFQSDRYHPLEKEIPPGGKLCIWTFSQYPVQHNKRTGPFYPKLQAVVVFFILQHLKLPLVFRHNFCITFVIQLLILEVWVPFFPIQADYI